MFDFIETTRIDAPAATVWTTLLDIEQWWPPSNPEHDSIERLDDASDMAVGTRFRIREKVAGVSGEAIGVLTRVEPGVEVTWESDRARYRLLGATFTVGEGVTWRVDPDGTDGSRLSAHVWARFPDGLIGLGLSFVFVRLLDGIEKDRRHTRIELNGKGEVLVRVHPPAPAARRYRPRKPRKNMALSSGVSASSWASTRSSSTTR